MNIYLYSVIFTFVVTMTAEVIRCGNNIKFLDILINVLFALIPVANLGMVAIALSLLYNRNEKGVKNG